MAKKLLLSTILVLVITVIVKAQSPAVDNLYRIALNGAAITIDGDLTDWQDAQWEYLSVDRPAYQVTNPTEESGIYPSSPNDASAWFAMKMDDNNVYFALRVRDENGPLLSDADSPQNLNKYDNLNVFLGLYDIGANAYSSPHSELLNAGFNLIDPQTSGVVTTNSTYRISNGSDNTTSTLGPDHHIGVRAITYGESDDPVTYNWGYVNSEVAGTEVATSLWGNSKGYTLEWKVPFASLAGQIGSGAYANFNWPLFTPQDGMIISMDAEIGDADQVTNGEPDTEILTLGISTALDRYSSRFGFRGKIIDMSQSPNNTPRRTYSVDFKLAQDVQIDGDLSDWLDAPFMGLSHDIPNWVLIQSTPESPADFSGYLAVKVDTANIYFAARIRDEGTPMIETLDEARLAFNYDHLSAYLGLYDISDLPSNPHVEGAGEFEMYNPRHVGTDSARVDTIEATRTYRIRNDIDNTTSTRGADYQITLRSLPYGDEPVDPEDYNGAYVDTTIYKGNWAAGDRTFDETGYILEWKIPFSSLAGEITSRISRFQFTGIDWPKFIPEDGVVFSFDADITDRDETDGARTANRFLRLGDQPALWRDSKSYSMRGEVTLTNEKVGVSNENEELTALPNSPMLEQNYPNPFNPSTNIQFVLPEASVVSLKVFNILGEEIATLVNGRMGAGAHTIRFEASSSMSSGIYFYQLKAGSTTSTRKLTLIK